MVMLILEVLLAVGGPALQIGMKLIPFFVQMKWIKDEADVKEISRRFKQAVEQAEAKAGEPDKVRSQYDAAKKAAKDAWKNRGS